MNSYTIVLFLHIISAIGVSPGSQRSSGSSPRGLRCRNPVCRVTSNALLSHLWRPASGCSSKVVGEERRTSPMNRKEVMSCKSM
jgi:hypothetical protein